VGEVECKWEKGKKGDSQVDKASGAQEKRKWIYTIAGGGAVGGQDHRHISG